MTKAFECATVVPGCQGVVTGETEQEVMQKAAEHGRDAHGLDPLPAEVQQKVKAGIHDQ